MLQELLILVGDAELVGELFAGALGLVEQGLAVGRGRGGRSGPSVPDIRRWGVNGLGRIGPKRKNGSVMAPPPPPPPPRGGPPPTPAVPLSSPHSPPPAATSDPPRSRS
nr:hypothetical protein [Nocardia wallacei]